MGSSPISGSVLTTRSLLGILSLCPSPVLAVSLKINENLNVPPILYYFSSNQSELPKPVEASSNQSVEQDLELQGLSHIVSTRCFILPQLAALGLVPFPNRLHSPAGPEAHMLRLGAAGKRAFLCASISSEGPWPGWVLLSIPEPMWAAGMTR